MHRASTLLDVPPFTTCGTKRRHRAINGTTIPDGQEVVWREKDGVRVVILRKPTPFKGAMLAKTVYRVTAAARARR